MTTGRDEAKKRRGRGKADDGPSDADLGWLAELRHAREDDVDLSGDRSVDRSRRTLREEPPEVPPPRRASREVPPSRVAATPPPGRVTPTPPPSGRTASTPPPSRATSTPPPNWTAPTPTPSRTASPPPPPNWTASTPTPTGRTTSPPGGRVPRPSPAPPLPAPPKPQPTQTAPASTPPAQAPRRALPDTPSGPPTIDLDRATPDRAQTERIPINPALVTPPRHGQRGSSGTPAARGQVTGMRGIELDSTTQLAPLALALKRQLRQVSRLRTATFVLLVLAIVGAPAAFFVIREFTRDPVFVELDNLDVPQWAAGKHTDGALGSRWCINECRSRQRTWESARGPEETNRAYVAALKRSGWVVWDIPDCQAEGVDGIETCWQRDEYVLDLWVRAAVCEVKATRPTVAPPSQGASGKAPTKALPSAAGAVVPPPSSAPNICPGAIVSIKVYNRISYQPGG